MNKIVADKKHSLRQTGMSLVEMMVAITISLIVLSGVVQALIVSKSNFISQRELAGLQENVRFALKYMTDEIRLAGSIGCTQPLIITDVVKGSPGSWYLDFPGLQGYEYDAGVATFPTEFRADVRANTDSIVVRRGESTGLRKSAENASTSTFTTSANHSYKPGQVMLITESDCEKIGMFQISSVTANTIVHNTGTASPGNGSPYIMSTSLTTYDSAGTRTGPNPTSGSVYLPESTFLALHSEAYFIGNSDSDSTVPALIRDRMTVASNAATTTEEELVQGVENMQILYGMDNYDYTNNVPGNDGLADVYVKANAVAGLGGWTNVVSVRITLRMRSINPVYTINVAYPVFEGVTGTDGSDRYMRQTVSSTIMIRNYKK